MEGLADLKVKPSFGWPEGQALQIASGTDAIDRAREGNALANVLDARNPGDGPFESQAESGRRRHR